MQLVYQYWWRMCQEIKCFIPGSNLTLRFVAICDLFTGTPSHVNEYFQQSYEKLMSKISEIVSRRSDTLRDYISL
jgi:hypothetical protein